MTEDIDFFMQQIDDIKINLKSVKDLVLKYPLDLEFEFRKRVLFFFFFLHYTWSLHTPREEHLHRLLPNTEEATVCNRIVVI